MTTLKLPDQRAPSKAQRGSHDTDNQSLCRYPLSLVHHWGYRLDKVLAERFPKVRPDIRHHPVMLMPDCPPEGILGHSGAARSLPGSKSTAVDGCSMLKAAARAYAAHPQRRGCLILEHGKPGSTEWGMAAKQIAGENRARVQAFLETSGIAAAALVADYVAATMLGLSAAAREGWDEARLLAVAKTAAGAVACRSVS